MGIDLFSGSFSMGKERNASRYFIYFKQIRCKHENHRKGKFMNKIVCLTAGHSNTDPGAVNGSDREADLTQDMRNIVAYILRNDYGLTVKTDGEGKGNAPLREALKLIKGSAVAIEFHTNAAANKAATGIEALALEKNRRWCQVLCQAVAKVSGWRLRGDQGYKPDNAGQHSRLAYAQYGGIVFEPFFISNDTDLTTFKQRKWPICRAIADAIAKELGVAKKEKAEE